MAALAKDLAAAEVVATAGRGVFGLLGAQLLRLLFRSGRLLLRLRLLLLLLGLLFALLSGRVVAG
jgi:hypothetical protein